MLNCLRYCLPPNFRYSEMPLFSLLLHSSYVYIEEIFNEFQI